VLYLTIHSNYFFRFFFFFFGHFGIDTPLSARGKAQAARLGKWLYGRLPVHAPLAIFCSPFIRCVQTADAIASELEGLQVHVFQNVFIDVCLHKQALAYVFYSSKSDESCYICVSSIYIFHQREGLHTASATRICIEPGLCEDMTYMFKLKQQEPWMLNAADLVCASPRIDLDYQAIRKVTHERGPEYPGGCIETTPGGTLNRVNTIGKEDRMRFVFFFFLLLFLLLFFIVIIHYSLLLFFHCCKNLRVDFYVLSNTIHLFPNNTK
jgi:hypothetical protein